VIHTEAAPPNNGSIIFPTMGSLQNRRKALRKIVGANNTVMYCDRSVVADMLISVLACIIAGWFYSTIIEVS
jgi:hypothetical protein